MTYDELNKIWADNGKGVRGLKYVYQQGRKDENINIIDKIMKYVRLHTKYADNTKNDFIYAHQMYEWLEQLKGR